MRRLLAVLLLGLALALGALGLLANPHRYAWEPSLAQLVDDDARLVGGAFAAMSAVAALGSLAARQHRLSPMGRWFTAICLLLAAANAARLAWLISL